MTQPNRLQNTQGQTTASNQTRILIIAVDVAERARLLEHLQKLEGSTLHVDAADSIRAARTLTAGKPVAAVILSLDILTEAVRTVIVQTRLTWPDAALVVLSATNDEAAGLLAIALGADEVLSRQDVTFAKLRHALVTSMARCRYHAARTDLLAAHALPTPTASGESAPTDLTLEPPAIPLHETGLFAPVQVEASPETHTPAPDSADDMGAPAVQPAQNTPAGAIDYHQIIESSPDVIFRARIDSDIHIEYVNSAVTTLTGFTPEEWIENPHLLFQRTLPDDRIKITAAILSGDATAFDSFRVQRKDGAIIWMTQRLRILTEPGVSPVLLEGTLRDNTEHILAKEQEQEQRVLAEALRDANVLLSSTFDLDIIFDRLLANVQRVVPLDSANIMLIEGGIARVVRSIQRNEDSSTDTLAGISFEIDQLPHMYKAITTRQTQYIGDTRTDPGWVLRPNLDWIRSHMIVPICAGEDVIGLLNVDSATPGIFDSVHAERLQAFADQVAIAARNATLYNAEREGHLLVEALREIATKLNSTLDLNEVLHSILELLEKITPYDTANIMLLEGDHARIVHGRGYAPEIHSRLSDVSLAVTGKTTLAEMMRTSTPMLIADTTEIPEWEDVPVEFSRVRSYLSTPIQVNGETLGFINLDGYTPNFFNERQIEPLQIFAEEAATAIHNAQLYTAEREGRALVEALRQVAATLNSTLDLDDVMHKILESVESVVPSDAANIMLIEDGYVQIAYWHGYTADIVDAFNHLRLPVYGTGNLEQMAQTHRPMIIPDTMHSEIWKTLPGILYPIRSYASAPIQIGEQVIGFINLDSFQPNFYTQKHSERLQVFADEAALAIQNAQLFAQVSLHAEELESRVQRRTLDLHRKKEEMEAILNSSSDAILLVSPAGFVRHNNTAALRFLSRLSGPNIPITDLIAPSQRGVLSEALKAVIEGRVPGRLEIDMVVSEGSTCQADLALSPIIDLDGSVSRVVCSFRDISLRKQMEAHLHQTLQRETELNEAMSRLVTVSSHELRTSLSLMQTSADLLLRYGDRLSPEEKLEEIEQMQNGIKRMTHLVGDVLTFHQFSNTEQKIAANRYDLIDITQSVIAAVNHTLDVPRHIELSSTHAPLSMCSDERLVQQIIRSLLTNADKFSPANTPITIALSASDHDVTIEIRDEGIGIPLEEQNLVWEVFYRASNAVSYEGTGVGLTVVKKLVTLLDGSIELTSENGSGTTVTVALPRIANPNCD
ncbi:MAG TPA: GAF domain-containing protein [Aggregatilinea sp.]|uniref:GAF domain-containing protein n=1 Tax=Aggregatilinea sp. TaxID=2806333 RepID=UPI002B65640B|nr:GAF domain-containing protein [Aggregatilinea sp.]HML21424.1 GAF domain-containing protein [Aggregatilinea sp.]